MTLTSDWYIHSLLISFNQRMQGVKLASWKKKKTWKFFKKGYRQTQNNNFANFPLLDNCVSKIEDVSAIGDISVLMEPKQAIATHLDELAESFNGHFPAQYPAWLRQPFMFNVEKAQVNEDYFDKIIEIQQSQVQHQLFRTTTHSTFWSQQMEKYWQESLRVFVPFVTTYLCERPFRGCWNWKHRIGTEFSVKMTSE